jgi:hypothetical protein
MNDININNLNGEIEHNKSIIKEKIDKISSLTEKLNDNDII